MKYDFDRFLVDFDKNKVPILEIVLNHFSVSSIDEIFSCLNSDEIYKRLYELEKTKEFKEYYLILLKYIAGHFDTTDFYFQKIPSFRLHRVNQKSVNFHNDVMYGHGSDVVNVWVPLVNTNEDNALYLSTHDVSKVLSNSFKENRLTLSEAEILFKKNSNPIIVSYGQMLVFKTSTIHGTVENKSTENRLSFDMRILPSKGDHGTKPLNEFYDNYSQKLLSDLDKTPCMYYLNKRNPLMKNCSHFVQREIINKYVKENNLIADGKEESEIYGLNHYPVIFHYIAHKTINNIVMASILCLPEDAELRIKVLEDAKKNNVKIHFSLENKMSADFSIKDANSYYELLLDADKFL